MKLKNLIMFSAAALAFAACNNDEEGVGASISGNGVVEVKLVAPTTRAVAATSGSSVAVKGDVTVTLTYAGGATKSETISAFSEGEAIVQFWDISNPTKVEATVNGGIADYSDVPVTTFIDVLPENIPAYGSSTTFTPSGTTEVNNGTTYEMYDAEVVMEIPVARLEISGITHVDTDDCKYETLTIDTIYLDKIKVTGGATEVTDYHYPAVGTEGEEGYIPAPILWDEIPSASFLQSGVVWPAEVDGVTQAYAFNFYPNGTLQMPLVKIYFAKATGSAEEVAQPRYAIIKSYNNDPKFEFKAGTIYRITSVQLADNNIIADEEGSTLWGVNVTVQEAEWAVTNITGEWVEE